MMHRIKSLQSCVKMTTRNLAQKAASAEKPFDKILIANRGEIACRVMRTAKRLGVKTVAIYSDADASSMHVKMADEAYWVGGNASKDSYLRMDRILEIAKKTGAQGIHPGYGFLSENAKFVDMCEAAGVKFIGPTGYSMNAMGDKINSKKIATDAKCFIIPGYQGEVADENEAVRLANEVGYPVMMKASAGGGGKGMRVAYNDAETREGFRLSKAEALSSFGDDRMLIERFIENPHHIEIQVLADEHGNVVAFPERECSVQRRNQKVVEESPSCLLTPATRRLMQEQAIMLCQAVKYRSAGTIEMLADDNQNFYFLEMNTRLQVEHPVTEMITGTDLVEWQFRVASGQPLPLKQEQIFAQAKGCAIEARIYAENPLNDFLPCTGEVVHLHTPLDRDITEAGVRVDSGIIGGNTVSTFYDPMIAKLIVHADTRELALGKLERALRDYQVAGLPNNIDFLVKCVQHPGFAKNLATTAFFEHNMAGILDSLVSPPLESLTVHTKFGLISYLQSISAPIGSGVWSGDSEAFSNFRAGNRASKALNIVNGSNSATVEVAKSGNSFNVSCEKVFSSSKLVSSKKVTELPLKNSYVSSVWNNKIEIDGVMVSGSASFYKTPSGSVVVDTWIEGQTGTNPTHFHFTIPPPDRTVSGGAGSLNPVVLSPMPGKVIKVVVEDGAAIKAGDPIVILEAMKMEHVVSAPCDGVVSVLCSEGLTVSEGSKIAEVQSKK